MQLVWPALAYLLCYAAVLHRSRSPSNKRPEAAREELAQIERDPAAFVAILIDREASSAPIPAPDGSLLPRLPGDRRWMWDGEFCGTISFSWPHSTNALRSYCLGHIGYSVMPWKRKRGYASRALRLLLPDAKAEGLAYLKITTTPDNEASRCEGEARARSQRRRADRAVHRTAGVRRHRGAATGAALSHRPRLNPCAFNSRSH